MLDKHMTGVTVDFFVAVFFQVHVGQAGLWPWHSNKVHNISAVTGIIPCLLYNCSSLLNPYSCCEGRGGCWRKHERGYMRASFAEVFYGPLCSFIRNWRLDANQMVTMMDLQLICSVAVSKLKPKLLHYQKDKHIMTASLFTWSHQYKRGQVFGDRLLLPSSLQEWTRVYHSEGRRKQSVKVFGQ